MYKLDPIEHLPDGSLFRLMPGQLRSVRGLAKRCCNFLDGDCLLLDGVCPQHISRSLLCRWFRRAVLPQQLKLEQAILSPKKLRRCEVCGKGILARSGRTKYCPACAKEVHRQQKAKSARKRRSGVDSQKKIVVIQKHIDRHFKKLRNPFHVLHWVEVFAVFFVVDIGAPVYPGVV